MLKPMQKGPTRYIVLFILGCLLCRFAFAVDTDTPTLTGHKLQDLYLETAVYRHFAEFLREQIDKNGTATQIHTSARQLFILAKNIIDNSIPVLPSCRYISNSHQQLNNELLTISYSMLQERYHLGKNLADEPKDCYHLKDLFVHPAIISVLLRDNNQLNEQLRGNLRLEIEETLEHVDLVMDMFSQ